MSIFTFKNINIAGMSAVIPENCFVNDQNNIIYQSDKLQTASDLGYLAVNDILSKNNFDVNDVGVLIFCTCTPDYPIPSTAFVLHNRLNLSQDCIVYDVNIAESGFVYGLQIACSLLACINKKYALLITADTMSKLNSPDLSYSDVGSAILLEKRQTNSLIKTQCFASGAHFMNEVFPVGAYRHQKINKKLKDANSKIYYNTQVYDSFLSAELKKTILNWLESKIYDYDFFIFRENNYNFIDNLPYEIHIPKEKILSSFSYFSDSNVCAIPLTIAHNKQKLIKDDLRFISISYGAGITWGITDFTISKESIFSIVRSNEFYSDGCVELI